MFTSSKNKEKVGLSVSHLNKTINESYDLPKITSTPLQPLEKRSPRKNSFSLPSKPILGSPRRYCLSDVTLPTNGAFEATKPSFLKKYTKPFLRDQNHFDSISVYDNGKGPGELEQIFKYDEEVLRRKSSFAGKYNKPGLLPIVHLFDKKSEQTPKRIFLKIGAPDYLKQDAHPYDAKLLEGITTSEACLSAKHTNDSRPDSVLDALKEISRKRIHSHEEYDLEEENNKKMRINNMPSPNTNRQPKRLLAEISPTSNNNSTRKKICAYDEYAASRSSSEFLISKVKQTVSTKRKSISTSTTTLENENMKHPKLVNAETQTIITDDETKSETKGAETAKTDSKSPVKVFNNASLESNRKGRLASLMGLLVGKEPPYPKELSKETKPQDVQKPEAEKIIEEHTKHEETPCSKALVPILSDHKKHSTSEEKHVHFNVPETVNDKEPAKEISESNKVEKEPEKTASQPVFQFNTSFTSLPNIPTSFNSGVLNSPLSLPSATMSVPKVTTSPPKIGGFKFNLTTPSKPTASSKAPDTNVSPKLQLSATTLSSSLVSANVVTFSSTSPMKFVENTATNVSSSLAKFTSASSDSFKIFNFGTNNQFPTTSVTPKTSHPVIVAKPLTSAVVNDTSKSVFGINVAQSKPLKMLPFTTSTTTTTTTTTTSIFGIVPSATTSSTVPASSTFNFGNKPVESSSIFSSKKSAELTEMFPKPQAASANNPPPLKFGNVTSPFFGNTTVSATPLSSNTAVVAFGNIPVTSQQTHTIFGNATSSAPPTISTASNSFALVPVTSAPFSFGGNVAGFGTSSSAAVTTNSIISSFTSQPAFGVATKTSFGTVNPVVSTSESSMFGKPTSTFTFGGNSNPFGAKTNTPTPTVNSSNLFTTNSSFGQVTTSAAAAVTNTVTFGPGNGFKLENKGPGFGVQPQPIVFGNIAEKTSASIFHNSGGGSIFTKPQKTESSFVTSSSTFGSGTSAISSSIFGSQQTTALANPSFGSSASLQPTANSTFVFGANNTPKTVGGFSFNAGSTTSPFGSTTAPSLDTTSNFGALVPNFSANGTPGVFNIGAGSTTSKARTQLKAKRRT